MTELYVPQIYASDGSLRKPREAKQALDIGCGGTKIPGATGMDILELPGVDIVHDIDARPWPIADASFDLVFLNHVLEHVDDVIGTMEEIHRVLKPGGRAVIRVPYFRCVDAYTDPTHRHFFTSRSLDYIIMGTDLSHFRYSEKMYKQLGLWLGWVQEPRNAARRALKRFMHGRQDFYDWYFSRLLTVRMVTWELEKI